MFDRQDEIIVSISGGKDSLALLDILYRLKYKVKAFHIHLGIPFDDYSDRSLEKSVKFCEERGIPLKTVNVIDDYGMGISELSKKVRRPACRVCGLTKRYLMNKFASQRKGSVLATGHNLDDTVASLIANLLRWDISYLAKHLPVLPEEEGFAKKVKPLILVPEREVLLYAVLRGIDFVEGCCPESRDATFRRYKSLINEIEDESPGTKRFFYEGFLKNVRLFQEVQEPPKLLACKVCGYPTISEICSFCRLWAKRLEKVEK